MPVGVIRVFLRFPEVELHTREPQDSFDNPFFKVELSGLCRLVLHLRGLHCPENIVCTSHRILRSYLGFGFATDR